MQYVFALIQAAGTVDVTIVTTIIQLGVQVGGILIAIGAFKQRLESLETRMREEIEALREQRREEVQTLRDQRREDLAHIDRELGRIERVNSQETERVRQSVGAVRGLIEKLLTEQKHAKGD